MEYIENSLDCENHNYRAESLLDTTLKRDKTGKGHKEKEDVLQRTVETMIL